MECDVSVFCSVRLGDFFDLVKGESDTECTLQEYLEDYYMLHQEASNASTSEYVWQEWRADGHREVKVVR